MPSAAQQLAQYGLTVDVARQWIAANLSNPKTVFDVCKNGGIDSTMIAEILNPLAPGLTAAAVENFFSSKGLNGIALRATPMFDLDASKMELFPEAVKNLSWQISMNNNTGELSTESLREAVLQELSQSDYDAMFEPTQFKGSADGIFTGAELDVFGLDSFAATSANLESLYYGTLVKCYRGLDETEMTSINLYIQANASAIKSGNTFAMEQLGNMILSSMKSPAFFYPAFDDDTIAEMIVNATVSAAKIVGDYDVSVFDAALSPTVG